RSAHAPTRPRGSRSQSCAGRVRICAAHLPELDMAAPALVATPARTGWDDAGKLILRVTVAVLMVMHGISKLQNGIGWMAGMLQSHHIPAFVGYGVYVAEVVAPILLILGLLTRLAALVIA